MLFLFLKVTTRSIYHCFSKGSVTISQECETLSLTYTYASIHCGLVVFAQKLFFLPPPVPLFQVPRVTSTLPDSSSSYSIHSHLKILIAVSQEPYSKEGPRDSFHYPRYSPRDKDNGNKNPTY